MRKIFPLQIEGRHPDRVMDALRHEIRKYLKRERRRTLPAEAHYWAFDCRCGSGREDAQPVALNELFARIDALRAQAGTQVYVEILARAVQRQPREAAQLPGSSDEALSAQGLAESDEG